ncbi:MAG: hypothetical protein ACE5LH_03535 [Fidelibacterota bacterium]
MKRMFARGVSVLLMGWVVSAPLLVSVHATFFHSHLGSQTAGVCREKCTDPGHFNPTTKHDWCQVRVFNYLPHYPQPACVSLRFSTLVSFRETAPGGFLSPLLPPSRASPAA